MGWIPSGLCTSYIKFYDNDGNGRFSDGDQLVEIGVCGGGGGGGRGGGFGGGAGFNRGGSGSNAGLGGSGRGRQTPPPPPPPQKEKEPSVASCAYDAVAEDPAGAALAVLGGAAFVLSTKARIAGALVGGTVSVAALGYSAATKDGFGGVISLAGKGTANAGGIASVGSAFARGAKVGGAVTAAAGILYEGQKIGNRFVQCRSGS